MCDALATLMNTGDCTGLLFATPSLLEGGGRVLDLADTLTEYNQALTPEQADYLALKADWLAVGADLGAAVTEFVEEYAGQLGNGSER